MGIYQVFYVTSNFGIFTKTQYGMQFIKKSLQNNCFKNLAGPKNLTSLTVKCARIGKTKKVCRQLYKLHAN